MPATKVAASASAQVQRPTTFDDLEDAVLELIFTHACAATPAVPALRMVSASNGPVAARYRHNPAIPQVSRRWSEVYVQSSLLWQELRLDWAVVAQQAAPPDAAGADLMPAFAAAARWLSARLPYTRRLVILGLCALAPPTMPPPLAQLFPGGLVSPRLREVRLLDAWGSWAAELPPLLQQCSSLQAVELACLPRAEGPQTALVVQGELLAGLRGVPALASLELHVDKIAGTTAEVATALSGLTQLSIRCRMESAALAPDLLEGLSQLRRLELENVRLAQFTPRLAQALSQLTHLSCCDVLAAQPRRRAGIQLWQGLRHLASLRELRLERQAFAGLPANALGCHRLQGLTLIGCEARDWPLAPFPFSGEGGCVGSLASLHLESLELATPIPPQLWQHLAPGLTSLTWRSVMRCPPEDQPLGLLMMPQLRMLQAHAVPAELAHLQGLKELRLEYAHLEEVPQAVQALPQVSVLSLEGNRISSLPVGRYLTGLCRLSLANNLFHQLPEGLLACSSLRHLSLAGNSLSVSSAAADQLARALPNLCCLRVSLPGVVPGAATAGEAAGAAPAAGVGGAGHDGPQQAQGLGHAAAQLPPQAAQKEHMEAMRHLARALGDRLVLIEP